MSSQTFPIKRSETIQVPINNVNVSKFQFTDNETILDSIKVKGIIIHTESVSTTFEGKTVVPNTIQKKAFLTLADKKQKQHIKRLPLESFFDDQRFLKPLDNIEVDVRKSFIELNDRAGLTTDMAFLVTFIFEEI
ncbi:MAG: hypothetical protein EKK37_17355 [Sphingobacteriales bacterium]|nr:MAG: hypothetical protein EKK37_17355 [Sphingobacteriales bacterium]